METVEIIVYIAIAMIVGALIIGFIVDWDARGMYDDLRNSLRGEPGGFEEVTTLEFPREIIRFWDACGNGATAMNRTVLLTAHNASVPATANKSSLFFLVKKAGLCKSLSSLEHDCGTREDVVMDPVRGQTVLRLTCDPSIRQLIVAS